MIGTRTVTAVALVLAVGFGVGTAGVTGAPLLGADGNGTNATTGTVVTTSGVMDEVTPADGDVDRPPESAATLRAPASATPEEPSAAGGNGKAKRGPTTAGA